MYHKPEPKTSNLWLLTAYWRDRALEAEAQLERTIENEYGTGEADPKRAARALNNSSKPSWVEGHV